MKNEKFANVFFWIIKIEGSWRLTFGESEYECEISQITLYYCLVITLEGSVSRRMNNPGPPAGGEESATRGSPSADGQQQNKAQLEPYAEANPTFAPQIKGWTLLTQNL